MRTEIVATAALVLFAHTASAQTAIINGTVYDSLRNGPLARATVVATPVSNTRDTSFHSALTDGEGRFRIEGLAAGRYDLTVDHGAMDSVGVHVPATVVDLSQVTLRAVSLATPSAATVRHLLCGDASRNTDGTMVGVVRRTDGVPIRGARVVFNWSDFELDRMTLAVSNRTESAVAVTNEFGVYRQCSLPVDRAILVQAQLENAAQSGILEERISAAGVLVRDFRVGAAATASSAGDFSIAGTVVDVKGQPIANAQVSMPSMGKTAIANERGEFQLTAISGGTQAVEVIALGFYPVSVRVEVDRGSTPVRVRMERTAVILDSMRVIAARTSKTLSPMHRDFDSRQQHSVGSYLTRAQIDSMRPVFITDVLRRMHGVHLVLPQGGRDYLIVLKGLKNAGQPCMPRLFLDGVVTDQDVIRSLNPSAIYGIEAYSGATSPPRYGVMDECGALFVWTR